MAKHTPGPWWIAGKATIRHGEKSAGPKSGWIADVHWRNREPNARLIAAAPDLLDALEGCDGDLVMLGKAIEAGDPKAELLFRIKDAQRLIRKATATAKAEA